MESKTGRQKLPLSSRALRNARGLRQEMTDAERLIWRHLRGGRFLGHKFRRQMPLPPYVLDFCCIELQLIIELDGSQHAAMQDQDRKRTDYLKDKGFTVLRFWNNDVLLQTDSVLEQIRLSVEGQSLTPAPLPEGEG